MGTVVRKLTDDERAAVAALGNFLRRKGRGADEPADLEHRYQRRLEQARRMPEHRRALELIGDSAIGLQSAVVCVPVGALDGSADPDLLLLEQLRALRAQGARDVVCSCGRPFLTLDKGDLCPPCAGEVAQLPWNRDHPIPEAWGKP